ncbi:MAG: carboxylating nicotinate-nucleotide diphosphorylase [Burkholderiales bacterium]|nr:carboxylating nicotinate-nucleotide diphosphorylase [Burkholderiales bacterium]
MINHQVTNALLEDTLGFKDYTANLIDNKVVTATITTRENMVLCGSQWVEQTLINCDKDTVIVWYVKEGDYVNANTILCQITALADSLLTAERTALNFLQLLSATATHTAKYVEKIKHYPTQVMDTRKTIPGLRIAQKYAVTVGGGYNQRIGLYDGVLIKENHIASCGGIKNALQSAFANTPKHLPIQIEVETFEQLIEAISNGATLILLDNMTPTQIKHCVEYVGDKATLEASGNITLDNIESYAQTGVHRISIGGLTKNIQAIDLTMRITQ